ncbi:MAG: Hsp20/alpha crystallin family protein [Phycisphaerales bacterium]|nr:Hsp20/alpha crystallin family protein [Phycisphaerales bacterium]
MNAMSCCRPASAAHVLDRLFENFFGETPAVAIAPGVSPGALALDVSEDDAHVIVRASVPGFTKDEVQVELHDGELSIVAEHQEVKEQSQERYYRRERRVGSLTRQVVLPGIDPKAEAEAELRDGVLTVRVARVRPETPRRVQIR